MDMRETGMCYLDWAATTPLCEEAAQAMAPYLVPAGANMLVAANPNSLHTPGRRAFTGLEGARGAIARCIGAARPTEVTFTSGATEADNLAVFGLLEAAVKDRRQRGEADWQPHFVTSAIEHDAVLATIPALRSQGVEVTVMKPDRNGFISPEALSRALRPNTALVSIMAANNEVGSVQDVAALSQVAHGAGALFHTDATQALGKIPVDVREWDVDAASFSAHKVCGPKGIGALYVRSRVKCAPRMFGGGQEAGLRPGTQNVMGAVGFAAACEALCANGEGEARRLMGLRDLLYAQMAALPGVSPSVECEAGSGRFLPNIVNVTVPGIESETLILQLDLAGFAVSGGSACSSSSLEPSHVLSALGIPRDRALCSLRVSMGRYTGERDIRRFMEAFEAIARRG